MMPQPKTLPVCRQNIPIDLVRLNQWVRWEWKKVGEHWTKVPYQLNSEEPASSDDPGTWGPFAAAEGYERIGFMFSREDEFCGVDLDNCIDPETGEMSLQAHNFVSVFDSYSEISPSGTGVKIFVRGHVPGARRRNADKDVEMYDSLRFFTVTGHHIDRSPKTIEARQEELGFLYKWAFGRSRENESAAPANTEDVLPNTDMSDEDILSKAFRAKNGGKFLKLYNGDISDYGSQSEADLALCSMITFWAGPDRVRIADLFAKSVLAKRTKWNRQDYRKATIDKALEGRHDFYSPPRDAESASLVSNGHAGERASSLSKTGSLFETFTLQDLMEEEFPPVRWAIKGLLPEGSMIFAGKPKMGKSWMALGMCIAVATGGKALGHFDVEVGDVLYLALEDQKRRLKGRARELMESELMGDHPPNRLHMRIRSRRLDAGLLEDIEKWLKEHPEARLVVIDTLGSVRGRSTDRRTLYEQDYEVGSALTQLAGDYAVSILIVHHLRKGDAEDPMDMISGSTGLTGGLDGAMVLNRTRSAADGFVKVVHRDLEEDMEMALSKVDSTEGWWLYAGDAEEYKMSKERRDILEVLINADEPMKPSEIADILDKTSENIRQTLRRMLDDGHVDVVGYGQYIVSKEAPTPATLHPSHSSHTSHSSSSTLGSTVTTVTSVTGGDSDQEEMEWE